MRLGMRQSGNREEMWEHICYKRAENDAAGGKCVYSLWSVEQGVVRASL